MNCALSSAVQLRHGGSHLFLDMRRYENGKYLKKKNTFTDLVAVAEHLIANKWTSSSRCSPQTFRL